MFPRVGSSAYGTGMQEWVRLCRVWKPCATRTAGVDCDFTTRGSKWGSFYCLSFNWQDSSDEADRCPCMTVLSFPGSLPVELICHELGHGVSAWAFVTVTRKERNYMLHSIHRDLYTYTYMHMS